MKRCRPQASIPQTGIHTKPKVLKGNYYGIQIKELAIGIHSVKRLACAPYNQGLGPCHPQPLHVNGLVSRYVQGYRTSFYYKLYHLLFLISIIPFVVDTLGGYTALWGESSLVTVKNITPLGFFANDTRVHLPQMDR